MDVLRGRTAAHDHGHGQRHGSVGDPVGAESRRKLRRLLFLTLDRRRLPTLTQTGTAIFPGGAWLPDRAGEGSVGPQSSLVMRNPARTLSAEHIDDIAGLIVEIEAEQRAGNYVAGYLSYEAGAAFGLATKTIRTRPSGGPLVPDSLPLAWMSVYAPASVDDTMPVDAADSGAASPFEHSLSRSSLSLNESLSHYSASIGRVREFIAAGDTYQVNYTVRARFDLGMDAAEYFVGRVSRHPVPYAAFLDLGPVQVISLSPELFLRRRGTRLESRPMKGTRPRGATPQADIDLGYELVLSTKDRAENLMIVDMVRNDLGRVCRTGSIHVPALFALEPYGTVWQMASTVTGELDPEVSLLDIMRATFPGASVTGAPKHHTMEIIRDLESEPRGAYTGAVCLFLPGGDFTCNLAIRTIAHQDGRCLLGVGSGVVWDSDAHEEYDETWTKAAFVFRDDFAAAPASKAAPVSACSPPTEKETPSQHATARGGIFETMLLRAGSVGGDNPETAPRDHLDSELERYLWLDDHVTRMAVSADRLGLPFARVRALDELARVAAGRESSVVRLDLDAAGDLHLTMRPVPQTAVQPARLLLSPFRTDPADDSLRHKTVVRPLYDREHARAVGLGCFDALFVNLRDRVTEGAISNLFARFGGRWVTPPLSDGLLPGIWRARFMADMAAAERSLTIEELATADEVVVGNSVRGLVAVGEIFERPW